MVNVTLLWSSTYKIVKVIKLFKKLPQRILGDNYNYNLLLSVNDIWNKSHMNCGNEMKMKK